MLQRGNPADRLQLRLIFTLARQIIFVQLPLTMTDGEEEINAG
jgi:hypothetical protein